MNSITLYIEGFECADLKLENGNLVIFDKYRSKDMELEALFTDPENVEMMNNALEDEDNWEVNAYSDGRANYDTLEYDFEDADGNYWLLYAERFTA